MKFDRNDYNLAINILRIAQMQLLPDGKNCLICGDNDHQSFECNKNPLVAIEQAKGFRCFYCGKLVYGEAASEHFGLDADEIPKCKEQ